MSKNRKTPKIPLPRGWKPQVRCAGPAIICDPCGWVETVSIATQSGCEDSLDHYSASSPLLDVSGLDFLSAEVEVPPFFVPGVMRVRVG